MTDLLDSAEVCYTANATFPISIQRHRELAIDLLEGVDARVIVSRSDSDQASLVVESLWTGSDIDSNIELSSWEMLDTLYINVCSHFSLTNDEAHMLIPSIPQASTTQSYHLIHLILPNSFQRLPFLQVSAPSPIDFSLHPSASDITFGSFSLRSGGDVFLPLIEGKHVDIETVGGNINGSFNVTERLILKTVTGDITANIRVHARRRRRSRRASISYDSDDEEQLEDHLRKRSPGKFFNLQHVKRFWWPSGPREELEELRDDDAQYDGGNTWEMIEYERSSTPAKDETAIDAVHNDEGSYSSDDDFEKTGPFSGGRRPSGEGPDSHHGRHGPDSPGPHRPDHSDGPRGPHRPDSHRRPHGPRGRSGPKTPAFIGAFSSTGSIDLHFRQPPFLSSNVKAFSHTGSVKVHAARSFKGYFRAGVSVGNVSAVTGGPKKIDVIKQVSSRTGGFVEGFVSFQHPRNGSEVDNVEAEDLNFQDWIIDQAEEFDR